MIAQVFEEYYPGEEVGRAIELAQIFGGTEVCFRNVDYLFRGQRGETIREEYDQGKSVRRLAMENQLCMRSIQRILNNSAA